MNIQELIEELKTKRNLSSYEKAAKYLGISGAALHKIRHGGGIDDSTAIKLAVGTGHPRLEVIAIAHGEKAKDRATKRFWKDIQKQMGTAANFMLALPAALLYAGQYILC